MAPRFDSENLHLELAVSDLIDTSLFRHIGFGQRGGYERMWVGQAIHSRYQEEAQRKDPSYRAEVPIRVSFEHRGWEILIRGRIDGLRREIEGDQPEDERTVLEEIKSVRRGSELADAKREIYERQALLYAWMLSLGGAGSAGADDAGSEAEGQSGLKPLKPEQIGAELVLIEIGSHDVRREPLEVDFEAIETSVRHRLNKLIRDHDRNREVAGERREAGERLAFPYPELRRGQQDIIVAAATALEQKEHLLIEAPTGLGKTVAALYPALKYALERQKRVFVLTAKTLQQDMATAVLELLNQDGTFRSLRLRAKSKMCANEEVICHEEFCTYAKDYYLKLHRSRIVDDLLLRYETLLPDGIFAHAREEEVCPFEVSLELSGKAQVVVCDYNYAFDPYVALQEFGQENDLHDTVLVVDEIHNLVDRGRGYYSPRLSTGQAQKAAEFLNSISHDTPRRAARVCHELAAWIADTTDHVLADAGRLQAGSAGFAGSREQAAETAFVEDDLWDLRPGFDDAFVDYVEYQRETSTYRAEDPFVDLYFDFLRFLDGLVLARTDAFSQYVQRNGELRSVNILCKDPSRFIGGVINRTHSTFGLSATLSPTDFYRDLLGFDRERTVAKTIASPFPNENRCFVIDDSISTLWRDRDRNYQPIADSLSQLAEAVPGNCLALFPSYAFIGHVAPKLKVSGKRMLVQGRGDSDQTRNEILDLLRSPMAGDNLLLAVAGGVFAEGVDYPGDILRAVAIIGPCLPALTLERELLKIYYQERFERGFEYAFVVPGMTRVVQAAGRLIRSDEDTGVIALLDQRFLKAPYRAHLPEDWYGGGRLQDLIALPGEAASRFFALLQVSQV